MWLPVEDLVLSHIHGAPLLAARYGPEVVIDLIAVGLLFTRFPVILDRLGKLVFPFAALIGVWLATWVWNSLSASTAIIGFRSELRFLPLILLPLLSRDLTRDARLYGRILVFMGTAEALLALAEYVGGPRIRAVFAPQYEIVLNGVSVAKAGAPLSDIFGTFAHRNLLGIFLAFAWMILAAAGSQQLGLSRRAGLLMGWTIVIGVFVSGSREGAIALVLAGIVIGRVRFRLPLARLAAFAAASTASVVLLTAPTVSSKTYLAPSSLTERWRVLLAPSVWKANPDDNFRLYFLMANGRQILKDSPFFGFGIGSASDSRLLRDGTSSAYKSFTGFDQAYIQNFIYDGNWAILILEVGLGGMAALGVVFVSLARVGASVMERHWAGLVLIGMVVAVIALGFFTSVLQERPSGAILWVMAGLAAAATRDNFTGQSREEAYRT